MILAFSGAAHAQNQSWFGRLCQPLIGAKTQKDAGDIFKAACKRKLEEVGCTEYFRDKDVPMSDRNNCEFTQVELQMALPLIWLSQCPSNAFDGAMNGPDILTGTIDTVWEALEKAQPMRQPTAAARRHERIERYKAALRDQVDFLSLPQTEKDRLLAEAQAERDRANAAGRVVEKTLSDAKIALYCYSPKKQVELSCYGLGVTINNVTTLTLVKGAYSGVKSMGQRAVKVAGGMQSLMDKLLKAAGFRSTP